MALSDVEARVLACLIEKEAATPDSYPLTTNALRLACNQATNRNPMVVYDDRTVDQALVSLKSQGLVRFVHPAHGGRTTRYRHSADERWRLGEGELLTMAMLTLRGPQTANEIRTRVQRLLPDGEPDQVVEHLDTLAARSPEPFAERLRRRPGEREERWVSCLFDGAHDVTPEPASATVHPETAGVDDDTLGPDDVTRPAPRPYEVRTSGPRQQVDADVTAAISRHATVVRLSEENRQLREDIADLTARLVRLERRLEVDGPDPSRPFDGAIDDDLYGAGTADRNRRSERW